MHEYLYVYRSETFIALRVPAREVSIVLTIRNIRWTKQAQMVAGEFCADIRMQVHCLLVVFCKVREIAMLTYISVTFAYDVS